MTDDKKKRAAIAGVMALLQAEAETAAAASAAPARPSDTPWAMNGRQTIMRNREFWQRRQGLRP